MGAVTPGDPGTQTGERTGSEDGPNDYYTSDAEQVVVRAINVVKRVIAEQACYAIGDLITYEVELTGNWAAGYNAVVSDVLDEGLTFVDFVALDKSAGVVVENDPPIVNRVDNTPVAGEETVSFTLGDISNDDPGVQKYVRLRYRARVDNLLLNQDGVSLSNSALFRVDDEDVGGQNFEIPADPATVVVGEPHLTLVKGITSNYTDLDAGDTVDFTVTVGNTGTTTAHEVALSDVLPAGLENVTSLQVSSVSGGAETPVLHTDTSPDGWHTDGFDIPVGGSVTITLSAEVKVGVIPGDQIQNRVDATFTSRDGADPNERDGSTADSDQDDDTDLNNYNESANAPIITVADPVAIDKRFHPDAADSTYSVGEEMTYRLTIQIIEGTVEDLVVTDILPDGVSYVSSQVGVGHVVITHNYIAPPSQLGQTLGFDLGQVVNPPNLVSTDDFLTIDITARVDNIPGNQDGTVLGNHAGLSFTGPSGTETRDYDADAQSPGIQPLDLTVVEPDLSLSKTVSPGEQSRGNLVTVTLVASHTAESTADAYDIEVADLLPAGLTYVDGSGVPVPTVNGQELTFTVAALTLGDNTRTFTYQARIETDAVAGVPLVNSAVLTWKSVTDGTGDENSGRTGQDGEGGLNDYRDDAQAQVTPGAPDILITKSDGDMSVEAGQVIPYAITVSNAGTWPATGVQITEVVPDNTTFDAAGSTQGWNCPDNSAAGTVCLFSMASLGIQAAETVVFAVLVADPVPAGVEEVVNAVSVADDGANGPDDHPEDNNTGDATPLTGVPDLTLSKDDGGVSVKPGGTISYTIHYENMGSQGATGVVIRETVPAHTVFNASASDPGWSLVSGDGSEGSVFEYPVGVLNGGSGGSVIFAVTLDTPLPAGVEQVENTTTIEDDGENSGGVPVTAADYDTTPADAAPDLSVSKDDGGETMTPGGTISYIIYYENMGSQGATGVVIREAVPEHTVFDASVSDPDWSLISGDGSEGSVYEYSVGALNSGDSAGPLVFAVTVSNPLPAGIEKTLNRVEIADDGQNGDDINPFDNGAEVETPVGAAPDLKISKNDGGISANPGEIIPYTVNYENVGTQGATGVVITETVPDHTVFNAGVSSLGWVLTSGDGGPGTVYQISVGPVDGGGSSGSVVFAVTVINPLPAGVELTVNSASITDNGSNGPDLNPSDNITEDTTPLEALPQFAVSKDDGDITAGPGDTIVYTIYYGNFGDQGATGVFLTETVPDHTVFKGSQSDPGWSLISGDGSAGSVYQYTVGALAGGGTSGSSVQFSVNVLAPLPGGVDNIHNVICISDDGENSGGDPITGTEDTPVSAAPDLGLEKAGDMETVSPGGRIVYTLTYTNTGTQGATGVVITETVPVGTTFFAGQSTEGWSCPDGSPAGTECAFEVGDLPVGVSASVMFAVRVNQNLRLGQEGQIVNTAVINDDRTNGEDLNPDDNGNSGSAETETDVVIYTVPTLNEWGMMALMLITGVISILYIRRRKTA